LKTLLFVCSGNTCRSPLAEGIAKQIFPETVLQNIDVSSAGTSAVNGLPASEMAINIARRNGIDLSLHRSRLLDRRLIENADLIIALTRRHREIIGTADPAALSYTYLLSDFCGGVPGDIDDPMGFGFEAYQETFAAIKECIEAFVVRLDSFNGWKNETKNEREDVR
jgi:protein-tyrosine-phosphatase